MSRRRKGISVTRPGDRRDPVEARADYFLGRRLRETEGCGHRHPIVSTAARVALPSGDVICLRCASGLDPNKPSAAALVPTTDENHPGLDPRPRSTS